MLKITKEQISSLNNTFKHGFIKNLLFELREEHEEAVAVLNDEELYEMIDAGMERAYDYELDADEDITAFVKLLLMVGWYFDRHELFEFYLIDDSCDPDERMDYIFEVATDDDWEAARELSDELVNKEIAGQTVIDKMPWQMQEKILAMEENIDRKMDKWLLFRDC